MTANRRLAAILAADVVGFSRLMGVDEAGTLATLKARRKEILEPAVAKHQGRVFKLTGDGVLIEFSSAVHAVACALELQDGFAAANSDVPDDQHIVLRIGVNLGDVMVEGSDLYGDGINVAARLEGLAEPGGILLSKSVLDLVKSKLPLDFIDLGDKELKNIVQPVRVYRVDAAAPATSEKVRPTESKKLTIAVLPFDNMGGELEQLSFSDGITEDITTELSKFKELLVIARNSSFQFRGKAIDVKDVAKKLHADFVVEGSVRRAGNRVRVTAQLIDAKDAAHLWAEKYDRDIADLFDVQDEIVRKVCARVSRQTRETILHRARARSTNSFTAYEYFLQAIQNAQSYGGFIDVRDWAQKALAIDPNFAGAHAMAAMGEVNSWLVNGGSEKLELALAEAKRAVALDANEAMCHTAVGFAMMHLHRYEEARRAYDEAIALNPNNILTLGLSALSYTYTKEYDAAERHIGEILQRDPYGTDWIWDVSGFLLICQGRYAEALADFGRMRFPQPWSVAYSVICLWQTGRKDEAAAVYGQMRQDWSQWQGGRWLEQPSAIFFDIPDQLHVERLAEIFKQVAQAAK